MATVSAQLSNTLLECFPTRFLSGARLYRTGKDLFRALCLLPQFMLELTFRSSFVFRVSACLCWPGSRLPPGKASLSLLCTVFIVHLWFRGKTLSYRVVSRLQNPDPSLCLVLAGVAGSRGFTRVTITPFFG